MENKIKKDSDFFRLHLFDSRKISDKLSLNVEEKFIDVTITSPPYHDIINYGKIENQIGYGQHYNEYLKDLSKIFMQIYKHTKDEGSLWIIVDTFTKFNKIVLLPYDIINEISKYGWILKDIIIWKKDKTRPWFKKGKMRRIFEYILFFVKSDNYKFFDNQIRDIDVNNFKEWWVKYPERYNPLGALPTNIWEFPIPVQGEWGLKIINHSNPLPMNLIKQIILLTTRENDVVLDPFSGSGMVLAIANALKRKYIGFELNKNYIDNFYNELLPYTINQYMNKDDKHIELQLMLYEKIVNLRILKLSKIIIKELIKSPLFNVDFFNNLVSIFIIKDNYYKYDDTISKTIHGKATLYFVVYNNDIKIYENEIIKILNNKEITRFQINVGIQNININLLSKYFNHDEYWLYINGNTHKFLKSITVNDLLKEYKENKWKNYYLNFIPPIISNIKVNENINKTWISKKDKKYEERLNILNLL